MIKKKNYGSDGSGRDARASREKQELSAVADVWWLLVLPTPAVSFLPAVFFFQAEDGIRDADVTGVQTCALPISVTSIEPRAVSPTFGICTLRGCGASGT